jgi:RNA polymerase sigma-70 factor (ECF subfamily)
MSQEFKNVSTEYLVMLCREGNARAFETLISLWEKPLAARALHLTGNQDAVNDIVQDSFLAIVKDISKLDDPACFKSWAYKIISFKSIDWIRKQQRQRRVFDKGAEIDENKPSYDSNVINKILIKDILNQLKPEDRYLLTLRYLEGLSIKEIADRLRIRQGTIKSRLHKIRKHASSIII